MSGLPFGLVSIGAQIGVSSILVKPKRQIGPFTAQVTVEELHDDEIEITDHPVELGSTISDHAFRRPATLTIRAGWSASPTVAGLIDGVVGGLKATVEGVQVIASKAQSTQLSDLYDKMLKLQRSLTPMDVYTGKRKYSNMLIRGLQVRTDRETENALIMTVNLREVLFVQTQVVAVTAAAADMNTPQSNQPTVNSGSKNLAPAPGVTLAY